MSKVYVGLSGGVDSAVSAALLKHSGHAVTGAFIKIWSPEFMECSWREDRLDAMRVAAALEIPFVEVDLSDAYKLSVIDDMTAAYARGQTPNPDVLCNEKIKFGAFLSWAIGEGAEFVATGHYARICQDDILTLRRGVDRDKDQSYFLHRLDQKQLARIMFPIGDYRKSDVRALAGRFALPNAARPDSQGLCFVGGIQIDEFLSHYTPLREGDVLDTAGNRIGTHKGAAAYTVGQRHGFTTDKSDLSAQVRLVISEPHYVVATDVAENTVTVSTNREDAARQSVRITNAHWISGVPTEGSVLVQTRYREEPVRAKVFGDMVRFDTPQICAAGQSLVAYEDDVCLGGGWIS